MRCSARTRVHARARLVWRLSFENARGAGPHFGFRHLIFELREQLRRFLQTGQRFVVAGQSQQRVAEHPQRLHQTIRVPGAPAQVHRCAVGGERVFDASLLQLNVCDRREMKRSLDWQQVSAGNFVVLAKAGERAIEFAKSLDTRWPDCAGYRPVSWDRRGARASPAPLPALDAHSTHLLVALRMLPRLVRSTATAMSS